MSDLNNVWKALAIAALIIFVTAGIGFQIEGAGVTAKIIIGIILAEIIAVFIIRKMLSGSLPNDRSKRMDIINRFCDKYGFSIRYKDVKNMADASYVSPFWAKEIVAMTNTYTEINEWMGEENVWVRIYLYTFPVKDITSDIGQLYNIVVDRDFNNIIKEINEQSFMSLDDCIESINNKHFLNFNKTSFAMMTQFMRKKGKKLQLADLGQVGFEDELTMIARKYM